MNTINIAARSSELDSLYLLISSFSHGISSSRIDKDRIGTWSATNRHLPGRPLSISYNVREKGGIVLSRISLIVFLLHPARMEEDDCITII